MAVIPFSISLDEEFSGKTFGEILRKRGYGCNFNHEVIRELKDTAHLPVYWHGNKYYINMSIDTYLKPKAGPYFLVPIRQKIVPAPIKETAVNSIPLVYTQEHELREDGFGDFIERAGYRLLTWKSGDILLCIKNDVKYTLDTKWHSFPRVGTYWLNEVQEVQQFYTVNFKDLSNTDRVVYCRGNKVTLNYDGVPSTPIGLWEAVDVPLRDFEVYVEIPYTYMYQKRIDNIKAVLIKAGYIIYENNFYLAEKDGAYYSIYRTYPTGIVLNKN